MARFVEVRESMFSQPGGRPDSWPGNSRGIIRMLRPSCVACLIEDLYLVKLEGVVMIETITPRSARSLAKSVKGIMWLCDIRGMRRK